MAGQQKGTGKHPHKSTEEPWPHNEAQSGEQSGSGEESQRAHAGSKPSAGGGGSSDLKEREYRDEQGNVHHHTRTFEEQHRKK